MTGKFSVNCSMLLTEHDLYRRPAVAAEIGFTGIELRWPFASASPSLIAIDRLVRAIDDAGVALVSMNLFGGDPAAGDRGIVSWPGRRAELMASAAIAAEIGRRTGCTRFNLPYGNRIDGVPSAVQRDTALGNVLAVAHVLAEIGGQVMLEPLSGAPRYPLRSAADAMAMITRLRAEGVRNVGLLADLYHLAVNGDDVEAVLTSCAGSIAHVQIADSPGRGQPGSGNLPLTSWMTTLRREGYRGWFGLEYRSSEPDPFSWLGLGGRGVGCAAVGSAAGVR